jgi:YD repeat-containing protein
MTTRTEKVLLALFIAALTAGAAATASETITYTYDARGRLVQVKHSGTVNNNVTANYQYDKADNRTNVNVTSPNPAP